MTNTFNFCPKCATPLTIQPHGGRDRQACPNTECGWVHWDNPTPVVAAVVERNGNILLVQSIGWPKEAYALVTGFLEAGEEPSEAVLREVKEETGLDAELGDFLGLWTFERNNQLLICYHVIAHEGEVVLETAELSDYKEVPMEQVRPWRAGTGHALNKFLNSRGHFPEYFDWPRKKAEQE
ncbi:NUDIX domain-containing protein [Pontibacter sp. G13]|uniref:NUDIX domain-containing protein n=1 Tax=Pontibacter sp. G13 TaxID=3074898 RepID=UPI00288AB5FA|nr:NUDIX domain-containing protein [Pontibacter sp. G13]WNJ19634.1 NUDIX domain-containing protein [Pontibacter sp. G13]